MEIELRHELSTAQPDDVPAMAARGDYMDDSLVGTDIHDALRETTDGEEYHPEEALRDLHKRLLRRGHFGPYEHATAFFAVSGISVTCERQLTRHRHMSFDVQSMRYVDFADADPVVPESFADESAPLQAEERLEAGYDRAIGLYTALTHGGVPQEDARFVLPLATQVNLSFSANSRALMHFIDMRHAGDAQWEIRELAERILEECKEWAPHTFELYEEHAKGSSKKAP